MCSHLRRVWLSVFDYFLHWGRCVWRLGVCGRYFAPQIWGFCTLSVEERQRILDASVLCFYTWLWFGVNGNMDALCCPVVASSLSGWMAPHLVLWCCPAMRGWILVAFRSRQFLCVTITRQWLCSCSDGNYPGRGAFCPSSWKHGRNIWQSG